MDRIRQKNADPTESGFTTIEETQVSEIGVFGTRYLYGDPAGEVFIAIEQAGCPIKGMSRVVNCWTLLKTNINFIFKGHRIN
jgi:hypothetical protein